MEQLIELIKSISPQVWATLVQQAVTEGMVKLLWSLILGGVSAGLWRYAPEWEHGNWETEMRFVSVLVVLLALWSLISGLMWLVNPEFYAIRFLLWQLPD